MGTINWFTVFLLCCLFGCNRPAENAPKQDIVKADFNISQEIDWVEFVKSNPISEVPKDKVIKSVILSYFEAHKSKDSYRIATYELARLAQLPVFDQELAKLAVSLEPRLMFYLKDENRSLEVTNLFRQAVVVDESIFDNYYYSVMVDANWSPKFVNLIFELHPSSVVNFPNEKITQKMIESLISSKFIINLKEDRSITEWPAWNESLANKAWMLDHYLYAVIPDKYKTLEMTRIILAENPLMIGDVPLRIQYPHLFP